MLARIDTADLEAKLIERNGALESAKAQLAMAAKTQATNQQLLKQNFISQNAYDNSESSLGVSQGTVKSAEAQVQLARNALRDAVAMSPLAGVVAKRHVQVGEKVAFDSPLVTVVDLTDMELQAAVPAVGRSGARDRQGRRAHHRRLRRAPLHRARRADQSGRRAGYARHTRLCRNSESRWRAAGRHVRHRPYRARGKRSGATLPATAVRTEAGQTFVWTVEGGKLVKRGVMTGRRDDATGRVELKTALPPDTPVLAARFDNLKDGAPAIVKAPGPAPVAGVGAGDDADVRHGRRPRADA